MTDHWCQAIRDIQSGEPQHVVARSYANAILAQQADTEAPDWTAINREALRRWKVSGLQRIKRMAWEIVK